MKLHPLLAALLLAGAASAAPVTPYDLPVRLPAPMSSPPEHPAAPYTPTVMSLIDQLLPPGQPSREQLATAAALLTAADGSNPSCHNLANVAVQQITTPRIMPMCFSDGLGLNVLSGPNVGRSTAWPSLLALGASFDPQLANAMGQAIGREGRRLMVTGYLGPQLDTGVFVNWARGHHTPGEDPWLNGVIGAAHVNGLQGQGLMAQVKHYAGYNGTADSHQADISDQAMHEMLLPPYEAPLREAGAASVMCSYQLFKVDSPHVPASVNTLIQPSPYGRQQVPSWPLGEAHYACEHPYSLTYILRHLWGSKAFVGADYAAVHSASALQQGLDREDPTAYYLGASDPANIPDDGGQERRLNPTGATCADANGKALACEAPGAVRIAGIPGPGCPDTGCGVANAVANGTLPLALFKQSLARVLYQLERFGMLGCDNRAADCANPGGVDGDRSGKAPLPEGASSGAPQLGTRNGNAAISMQVAEQGAVLLKNTARAGDAGRMALPIEAGDLAGGVAVSGGGAEYLVSNPNNEGAVGFAERNAINPLQQLMALSGSRQAFVYTPANGATGQAIPSALLSSGDAAPGAARSGLARWSGAARDALQADGIDAELDFTSGGARGQLQGGKVYRWSGWVLIPAADRYILRVQHSAALADADVSLAFDGADKTLAVAESFYHGQFYGLKPVAVAATNAGYVEAGLRNRQCALPPGAGPGMAVPIFGTDVGAAGASADLPCESALTPGWRRISLTLDASKLAAGTSLSVRLAWSRADGDIADAAAAARGKSLALVFVHDEGRAVITPGPVKETPVSGLHAQQVALIRAVAEANPNTVVVLNTGTPVIVRDWIDLPNVRAVLNMWQPGQEGGTATARLLLGQANPGGHTTITWPRHATDTIHGYEQAAALYPGDTPGRHPERLNGGPGDHSRMTQGIYSGYRYYDKLDIPVEFPFGYGLSYTRFSYADLKLARRKDGGVEVSFTLTNIGKREGAAVPQVYVGAGPQTPGVQQALRALRGFQRVVLKAGERRRVTIALDPRSFQHWSTAHQQWRTLGGKRTIWVGEADAPQYLPLSATVSPAATAAQRR